jgi:DNA polymerase-1
MTKALIDADSILYKVCFAIEDKVIWNEPEYDLGLEEPEISYYSDLEVCKEAFDLIINNILYATDCTSAELAFTGSHNLRTEFPISYKENRAETRKPLFLTELKNYAMSQYDSHLVDGVEADDVVVYLKTTYPEHYFLCAIDKDVLYQTVGTHYNYNRDEDVHVDEHTAKWYPYFQTLAGDRSDGYIGCRGIGEVKAKKLLADAETEEEMWEIVVKAYKDKGMEYEDAVWTMRLANMHQYDGKKFTLWQPFDKETGQLGEN